MKDRELPKEVVECNEELCQLWMDEVDPLEMHRNTSLHTENEVIRALNATSDELDRWKSILHGYKLREIFGYTAE